MRRIALLVAVATSIGAIGFVAASGSDTPTYEVTADVAQAPNLFEGARVMVRGVQVGDITDVEPRADAVRVTLAIHEGTDVPADARLAVVPITIISDRYVQLFPPYIGGPKLSEGDHLDLDRTSIPAELDDVLEQLKGLLSALEPQGNKRGPLARLIGSLDEATRGKSRALSRAIDGSAGALGTLATSHVKIERLVRNLDRLFITLAGRSSDIGLLNDRLALVTEALLADQQPLEGTLENVAFLSGEGSRLIDESGDALGESFGRLAQVLDRVLEHEESLIEGTEWTNVIARALGATDASGRGLFAYSGRQAAPGTPGAEYNYRIDTRDTVACERLNELVQQLISLNPNATTEELAGTALTFIADTYDDDLRFLIEILIPYCAEYPSEHTGQASVAEAIAHDAQLHSLGGFLDRWFATKPRLAR